MIELNIVVGKVSAVQEKYGALSCSKDAFKAVQGLGWLDREIVAVIHLNNKNRVIMVELVSIGTNDNCAVYPKAILRSALLQNSASIVLIHNHMSGDPTPSMSDNKITEVMVTACEAVQVVLLDHIIVSPEKYYSYADEGRLPAQKGEIQ